MALGNRCRRRRAGLDTGYLRRVHAFSLAGLSLGVSKRHRWFSRRPLLMRRLQSNGRECSWQRNYSTRQLSAGQSTFRMNPSLFPLRPRQAFSSSISGASCSSACPPKMCNVYSRSTFPIRINSLKTVQTLQALPACYREPRLVLQKYASTPTGLLHPSPQDGSRLPSATSTTHRGKPKYRLQCTHMAMSAATASRNDDNVQEKRSAAVDAAKARSDTQHMMPTADPTPPAARARQDTPTRRRAIGQAGHAH